MFPCSPKPLGDPQELTTVNKQSNEYQRQGEQLREEQQRVAELQSQWKQKSKN